MKGYGYGYGNVLARSGYGRGPASTPFEVPLSLTDVAGLEALLEIGLTPDSLAASPAGQWNDISINDRHHTFTGSPVAYASGPVLGLLFDGVNDRIDALLGGGFDDTPCSIFLLLQVVGYPAGGSYAGIAELSDTTGSDRSHWLHLYGPASISVRTNDSAGAIAVVSGSTDPLVIRIDVTSDARSMWINGVYVGSSAMGKTSRTVTRSRLGQRIAGDVNFGNFVLYSYLVYSGRLDETSKLTVENGLMQWGSIARPFDWTSIPAATTTTGDPRIITPTSMDTMSGFLRIEDDAARYRNGRMALSVTNDAIYSSAAPPGRTVVYTATGCTFTVTEGAYSRTTTVTDHEASDQSSKYVLLWGDSNANRARTGVLEMLSRRLGAHFVGDVAAAAGFNARSGGHDSYVLSATALALGAAGAFDAAGSPFYMGGGSLSMAAYFASLSHVPTHAIMCCLQNGPYLVFQLGQDEAALETVLAAEKTAALNIFAAMHAAVEDIPIGVLNGWTLNADPASGWTTWSQRDKIHRYMHRAAEVAAEIVTAAQGLGINASLISTCAHVGIGVRPESPWEDFGHLSPWGHQQLLSPIGGWILAN